MMMAEREDFQNLLYLTNYKKEKKNYEQWNPSFSEVIIRVIIWLAEEITNVK